MLIIKRTRGETVHILPANDLPPEMTVHELFADGGIEIHVFKTKNTDASIGIEAPSCLLILRDELINYYSEYICVLSGKAIMPRIIH